MFRRVLQESLQSFYMFIVDTLRISWHQILSPRCCTSREAVCHGTMCWAAPCPPFMLSILGYRAYRSYSRLYLVRWHSLLGRWQMCVEYFIWFVKLHNELDYLCLWPKWKLIHCCFFSVFNFRSSCVCSVFISFKSSSTERISGLYGM